MPVVLSKGEVKKILNATSNIKHKAILMLMYSGGLRVGEIIKLRPEDIDSNRKLIHIRASKGRKDRYTLLSNVAFQTLREYWKKEKPQIETGIDLRYIQELLGHKSSNTTEIYTHVSAKNLLQ